MGRVDAHHHLLYPEERTYPFLQLDTYRPLERRYGVEELRPGIEAAAIDRTIAIETVPDAEETERLLHEAAGQPTLAGVVGWVDLMRPGVGEEIARLRGTSGGEHLVGVRHLVHDEPDPDWLIRPAVLAGLREVHAAGLPFDLLIRPRDLPASLALADAIPELRLVVDHIAKPRIGAEDAAVDAEWERGLRALAVRPQVSCKLSGMVTETTPGSGWTVARLRPYLDRVLAWFGPERLMFGSDWPVCLLAAEYREVHDVVAAFVADTLSPAEQRGVLGDVASAFYDLPDEA